MFPSCRFHRHRSTLPYEHAMSSILMTANLFVRGDSWVQTQSKYAFAINFSRSQIEAQRVCTMPSFILFRLITLCIFSTFFVFFPICISCASPSSVLLYGYILYLISHQVLHFYLKHCFSASTKPFSFQILPFYVC